MSNNTSVALFKKAPLPQAGSTILIFFNFSSNLSNSDDDKLYSEISCSTVFASPLLLK